MKKTSISTIILEEKTSIFIFLIPSILSLCTILYSIGYKNLNIFSTSLLIVFYYIYPFITYYKRKIIIKNNRVDIYFLGKKQASIHYLKDFYSITYQQDKLGKIFNYGSLIIIDQNKKIHSLYFLNKIFETYETIITTYESYLTSKNKNYIKIYNKDENINEINKEKTIENKDNL